jgi:hypothetical protein
MPAHKDYKRYNVTGAGWWGTQYERNEDYEQNRRMTTQSNTQRAAIMKQLDASIARLDRQSRALTTQIAATADPVQSKALAGERAKTDALIAERRRQRQEELTPSETPTKAISLKEALSMDKALQTENEKLRRDFTTLFQRYNTYVNELSALHAAEAAPGAKGPEL